MAATMGQARASPQALNAPAGMAVPCASQDVISRAFLLSLLLRIPMPATYAGLLSRPRALLSLLAVSALALLPAVAQAHFMLLQPSSAYSQGGTYGDPQRPRPVGQARPIPRLRPAP